MKPFVRLALLALVVGTLAFSLTRWLAPHPHADTDEMAWMKTEFHLTPAQTTVIEKLHDDYGPVCMEHCRLIREARARLTTLEAAKPRNLADYAAAQAEMTRLKGVCHGHNARAQGNLAFYKPRRIPGPVIFFMVMHNDRDDRA